MEHIVYWIEADDPDYGPWRVMYQLPAQTQATAEVPPCLSRRQAEERARARAGSYAARVNKTERLAGRGGAQVVTLQGLPLWARPLDRERERFCFVVRSYRTGDAD